MDLIDRLDDDDLPLPKPWDERPISYARWRKHHVTMMQWAHPGHRPEEWWAYEKKRRKPSRETNALYNMGELSATELSQLMPGWRDHYARATDPDFAYCIGQKPGATEALWITGPAARRAFFQWCGIPDKIVAQFNQERRRRQKTVRRLKAVASA